MMYLGATRADTTPMMYQPMLSKGVAIMTVSAAAMTRKPSVACQDHTAEESVQIGSHQRAA